MNIKLISSRWGELTMNDALSPRQKELPAEMIFPTAEKKFASNEKGDYRFVFQQLTGKVFKVRVALCMSMFADTYSVVSEQEVCLHFALLYSHQLTHPNMGRVTFHQNNYNFVYLSNMAYVMKPMDRFITIDVILPKDYLQQFEGIEPLVKKFNESIHLVMPGRMQLTNAVAPIEILRWYDDIVQYGCEGMTDRRLLDEYVEQLISECVQRLKVVSGTRPPKLSQAEVDRIYTISDLVKDSDDPVTIDQLAKFAGLTNNKLDKGFKYIFGHSVLHHRKEEKMRMALRLVADKTLCQKEVASILGYKEPQSFSRAFKGRFGYAPYRNINATAPKS